MSWRPNSRRTSTRRISIGVLPRKLLAEGLDEWRREQALEEIAAGTITFSNAAEMAGMSVWDFAQLVAEHDITWVADDHLEADLEAL